MQKKSIKDSVGRIVYWQSDNFDLSRDTLFFLHGLTADHTMFEQQFPAFKENYNIIVWDAPAHGESRPYPEFPNAAHNSNVDNPQMVNEKITDFLWENLPTLPLMGKNISKN